MSDDRDTNKSVNQTVESVIKPKCCWTSTVEREKAQRNGAINTVKQAL